MDVMGGMMVVKEGVEIADKTVDVVDKGVDIKGKLQDQENKQRAEDLKHKKALADYFDELLAKLPENIRNIENAIKEGVEFKKWLEENCDKIHKCNSWVVDGIDTTIMWAKCNSYNRIAIKITIPDGQAYIIKDIGYLLTDEAARLYNSTIIDMYNKMGDNRIKNGKVQMDAKTIQNMNLYVKPHSGSKVKDGMYKGCKLKIYGSEVQIEDEINMESISLTPKYVKECKKTEKYFNVTKVKNYYHYEIIYNDGTSSYVRMSKRYHQLIDSCFKKNK